MSTRDSEEFDAIVIGGGQGASLAVALARAGKKTAVVEKQFFGGTCVNYGCTPTKALIASARVAYQSRHASKWGVSTGEVEVDFAAVAARKNAIVADFRRSNEKSLEVENLEIVCGEASFVAERTLQVLEGGATRILTAPAIVIATGSRNVRPQIEGLEEVPWLDSTSLLEIESVPGHLVILGGGVISVEFAQAFRRFGARVTIIEMASQLLPHEDEDVAHCVRDILEEEGVQVLLGTEALKVERSRDGVRVQVLASGERKEVEGSHLLVAVGREPETRGLNLDKTGVKRDEKGFVQVDEFLKASAPGIYAMGDVAGSQPFTHMAYDDARVLCAHLIDAKSVSTHARLQTWTVFLDPQLGRVGLSEAEARRAGKRFGIARIRMDEVARPLETGEARGFWKVLVEKETGQILGGAFLSMDGGEMAALCQVAMLGKMPYSVLRDLPISHPTLAEAFNNLFLRFERGS
jgi:pyruvate/2-oxoglutarate dehydrogenase complex dihydrolipoamide dehydrogenase (E3) component